MAAIQNNPGRAPVAELQSAAEMKASEDVIAAIVDRVVNRLEPAPETLHTASLCLIDALACALGSLQDTQIQHLLGPYCPGTVVPNGARVPGTSFVLDPIKAAFDTSVLIRWLDISDTSPVGGHPSDNIGAILAAGDYVSRIRMSEGHQALTVRDILRAMVDAYEIHCSLAAANRFDRPDIGLDHVIYVKIASAAVTCRLMGGDAQQIKAAVSNAWLDGQGLNAYRHVPNAGARKGWAGGNAASRGLLMAWLAMRGEKGAPQPLSAPVWGFNDVFLNGDAVKMATPLGTFFMDNVIFKLVPAQRNCSTAIEAAIRLHAWYSEHKDQVARVRIVTHDEAIRRVTKTGPLPNREARDHCIQYMVAVALLRGRLELQDYTDEAASDPAIDQLRKRITVEESPDYTADHHDLTKRSCANSVEIITHGGLASPRIEILYPIGDALRRSEAAPMLREKFFSMTAHLWNRQRQDRILGLLADMPRLLETPVTDFMSEISEAQER